MEWFALIIPIFIVSLGWYLFRRSLVWWELCIPILISVAVILICKVSVKTALVRDTEYWGSMVTKARYYEYWESWVKETCSYTTTCCCDSKGQNCQTQTHYYDCSYMSRHQPYWEAYDDAGNTWRISEGYYNYIKKKWGTPAQFIDMDRSIRYHSGGEFGGKDGDAYEISWNGTKETSEAAVTTHSYTNRVQASHSAFKLPHITKTQAQKYQLYAYPEFYDYYKQTVVLGLDSIYDARTIEPIQRDFEYFNGHYGVKNKVKLFVLLFYDKDISIVEKQKAYWDGGNQNEIVVCIGLNRATKELQWVLPFSWTDRKRVMVDIREDIMEQKYFDPIKVYAAIENSVNSNIMYKNFKKDFSYLEVDLPNWSMWLIYILATIFAVGSTILFAVNGVTDESQNDQAYSVLDEIGTAWQAFIEKLKNKFK